jgi:hypothetical protein
MQHIALTDDKVPALQVYAFRMGNLIRRFLQLHLLFGNASHSRGMSEEADFRQMVDDWLAIAESLLSESERYAALGLRKLAAEKLILAERLLGIVDEWRDRFQGVWMH